MSPVHDMGGRLGYGAVDPKDNESLTEPWHAKVLAVTLAAGALGKWSIDESRHAREMLSPVDYCRFSYYEKWLAGLTNMLLACGVVSRQELKSGHADTHSELAGRVLQAKSVGSVLARGSPYQRSKNRGKFKVGDLVRSRKTQGNIIVKGGHTRLPSYAAGVEGQIIRCHGTYVLPDTNAHGLGENAEPLYAVAFASSDLWARASNHHDDVIVDLWQSYLEFA
ncbi:nitrile hydratase subunit beta [Pseudopelagicola sp. nBUS_20]|uniref:nitrile hydratase subunit beta n=1 Tax=Pseudopelagicola sp. nBUS_20 TaxID=3395317 RepID=UPI003EBC7510